jgi:UDP-N-acetylmuramate--alanine ligase
MIVGGVVGAFGSNAHLGTSDLMVVEADESDRSFLMLTPTIAVVTNIDREHMDYYHDMDDVRACFVKFVNSVPFYGSSVLCLDDPNVQAIIPLLERRRMTYGLSAQADVSAHGIRYDSNFGSTFAVWRGSDVVGDVTLRVPGMHNVYNSLAAIAVGFELEVSFDKIAEGLNSFTGAGRRFQAKGEVNDVLVVDDYGHHPTEVRATLAAAKLGSGGRRIVVLFQPHRYTRTHDLMQEFARSFNNADVLFITDIYAASEDPIEGVTSEALTNAIKRFGHKEVNYIGGLENAATLLRDYVQPGDLVLTLGAGTVNRVSDQLVGLLQEQAAATTGDV